MLLINEEELLNYFSMGNYNKSGQCPEILAGIIWFQ